MRQLIFFSLREGQPEPQYMMDDGLIVNGWLLDDMVEDVKTTKKGTFHQDRYDPTRARSFVPLPEPMKNRKACINIQNEDNN